MTFKSDWEARIFALFLITATEFVAQLVLPFAPRNDLYFVICGTINLGGLLLLTVTESRQFMVDLTKLTFLQLCLQFLGWCLYCAYSTAHFYNWSIHIVVAATYLRILWPWDDAATNTDRSDRLLVRRHYRVRSLYTSEVPQ